MYPRQRQLSRCKTTAFYNKVTDTNRACCEQTPNYLMPNGGTWNSVAPPYHQMASPYKSFCFNDLFKRRRRPARGYPDIVSGPRAGSSKHIRSRSAPLVASKHEAVIRRNECVFRNNGNGGTAETARTTARRFAGTAPAMNYAGHSGVFACIRSPIGPRPRRPRIVRASAGARRSPLDSHGTRLWSRRRRCARTADTRWHSRSHRWCRAVHRLAR